MFSFSGSVGDVMRIMFSDATFYQFLQSPLLYGTARPLTSNLEWHMS